jgi:N,N'-diacetyllegionaminate synthase
MEIHAEKRREMDMNKVFIIAEAGVNHNGSIELAKQLIDQGSKAGVDAVKFQSFKAEKLVTRSASKAQYQTVTTGNDESQFSMIKKLELDYEKHQELMDYCSARGVMFLSSAFDLESINLLVDLGLYIFKIPSGEITNLPYLRKIGQLQKKVILSTGMSTIDEIEQALRVLRESGTTDITVLHCNTEYPTPMSDVNLTAMQMMREVLQVKVGYSDHTVGIEVPIAAVALGATVIEKHFTLDKHMEGPDHRASLEPHELSAMVSSIRNIEQALGNGVKRPSASELKNKDIARKSLVAARAIVQGEVFTTDNLTVKRPGSGISPMRWDDVMGKRASRSFQEDELIEL